MSLGRLFQITGPISKWPVPDSDSKWRADWCMDDDTQQVEQWKLARVSVCQPSDEGWRSTEQQRWGHTEHYWVGYHHTSQCTCNITIVQPRQHKGDNQNLVNSWSSHRETSDRPLVMGSQSHAEVHNYENDEIMYRSRRHNGVSSNPECRFADRGSWHCAA